MATHRLPREVIAQRKGAVVPYHQTRHRAHSPEVEIHHRAVATANSSYLSQKRGLHHHDAAPSVVSGFANPDHLRLCVQNLNLRNQKTIYSSSRDFTACWGSPTPK